MRKNLFLLNTNTLIPAISFLTGVFVTMPIITLPIGRGLTSVFTILFNFLVILTALKAIQFKKAFVPNQVAKALFLFFLISFLSSVTGVLYFLGESEWVKVISNFIPKILIYALFLLSLLMIKSPYNTIERLTKGFILGCVLNIIWSIIESVYFYSFSLPLNEVIFSSYINTLPEERQYLTVIKSGIIRASGFNYDPAHLGAIIPIIVLYATIKKRLILLILAVISLVFSASTTALVGSLLSLIVSIGKLNIFNYARLKSNPQIKIISLLLIFLMIFSVSIDDTIFNRGNTIYNGIKNNTIGFRDRVLTKTKVDKRIDNIRYKYYAYIPEAISFNGVLTLTGTGLGTGSYPYVSPASKVSRYFNKKYSPYDPESTYISYLFDIGIFGLLLYLFVLLKCFLFYRKKIAKGKDIDVIFYSALCGMIFSGIFYHYILTAHQVILLILSVVMTTRKQKMYRVSQI